jgi:uncharacterized membrane protein YidH (DUF202 family)
MIRNFSDHAANKRTFLAWTRPGLTIIAFGFVIEKFNVMVATVANTASPAAAQKLLIQRLAAPLGRYDGIVLILVGIGLIVIAGARYARPPAHRSARLRARELRSQRNGSARCVWRCGNSFLHLRDLHVTVFCLHTHGG